LIIGDLDDLLIPQIGQNYQDELQIFDKRYPSAAVFSYTRFETSISTGNNQNELAYSAESKSQSQQKEIDKFQIVNPKSIHPKSIHF
jgi:hypothetical protein